MPAKEIKELKIAGKLDEALAMAKSEFEASPENIWTKRNLAWVYYMFLKRDQGNQEVFMNTLNKVLDLKMLEDEELFFEKLSWALGMHIFTIAKSLQTNKDKFNSAKSIFKAIKSLKPTPSKGHSFLLQSLHKAFKEKPFNKTNEYINTRNTYIELFQWAGFDSFMKEDFQPYEINGKKTMSFVEQVIIAYSKVLLKVEIVEVNGKFVPTKIDKEKVDAFLIFIDKVIKKHPEYQYSLYFKSKLLLALNRFEDAKKSLIPFVKKKKNDFWVWELLGEAHAADIDIQVGCLCKALTLNTKESFLGNVHQKLTALLVQKELFKEASIEALNAINIRKKNDWKINNELIKYTHQNWFVKNQDLKNNKTFYQEQALLAEELLYNNHKEVVITIDFVNTNKKIANFIKDKSMYGFFSYKHLKINPKIGDMYIARLNKKGEEGFFTVLTIKQSTAETSACIKEISGQLRLHQNGDFGFINDNFVPPEIVKSNNLKDGVTLSGNAILSFNKKKKQCGWKVFQIK